MPSRLTESAKELAWTRALQDVRDQAGLLAAASSVTVPGSDEEWLDIARANPSVKTEVPGSGLWQQKQWRLAFEVLVRQLALPKIIQGWLAGTCSVTAWQMSVLCCKRQRACCAAI